MRRHPLFAFALLFAAAPAWVACTPEASLEGADLVATFTASDTVEVRFEGVAEGCVTGAVFAGEEVTPSECTALELALPDAEGDGTLEITSGGSTVSWTGQALLAHRKMVRADSLDQIPRGAIVRVNAVPATDVLAADVTAALRDNDGGELELTVRVDGDGIVIDIPGAAEAGPQELVVSVPFEVPTVSCEGFASCTATGTHGSEPIAVVIAP